MCVPPNPIEQPDTNPLIIAVGPTAQGCLSALRTHPDAYLVDVVTDVRSLTTGAESARPWIACIVDLGDEPTMSVLEAVSAHARSCSSLPPISFVVDARVDAPSNAHKRLAAHLRIHVVLVDGGASRLLASAMLLVSALCQPGLLCLHSEDIAVVCSPPARVGCAGVLGPSTTWPQALGGADIADVFVLISADEGLSLYDVAQILSELEAVIGESASILAQALTHGANPYFEVAFIAFHAPARCLTSGTRT